MPKTTIVYFNEYTVNLASTNLFSIDINMVQNIRQRFQYIAFLGPFTKNEINGNTKYQ